VLAFVKTLVLSLFILYIGGYSWHARSTEILNGLKISFFIASIGVDIAGKYNLGKTQIEINKMLKI